MSNATITRRDYKTTTRLWGKCVCGCTWRWNGKTEHVDSGVYAIEHGACFCPGEKWGHQPGLRNEPNQPEEVNR